MTLAEGLLGTRTAAPTPQADLQRTWYVRLKAGEEGPVCLRDLSWWAATGVVSSGTPISLDRKRWRPASKLRDLAESLEVGGRVQTDSVPRGRPTLARTVRETEPAGAVAMRDAPSLDAASSQGATSLQDATSIRGATSKKGVPSQGATSQGAASQGTTSQGATSQGTASQGTASQGTMSQGTMSQGTASQGAGLDESAVDAESSWDFSSSATGITTIEEAAREIARLSARVEALAKVVVREQKARARAVEPVVLGSGPEQHLFALEPPNTEQ